MNSNIIIILRRLFEIQVAKATNGQKNGYAEENESIPRKPYPFISVEPKDRNKERPPDLWTQIYVIGSIDLKN